MNVAGEEELISACQILFGYQLNVSRDFLRYIQPSGVKTAYRKRARETHPDMIAAKGKAHGVNSASFLEVQSAYENLSRYLSSRQTGSRFVATPRHTTARRPRSGNTHRLPRRKLLLGQFLYHSGIISWRTMIQSLGWQMTQRPRMGELANNLGWLSDKDIQRIAGSRQALELFGSIAVKLGLLNEFQVKVLLTIQRRRQRRLGDYFVDNGVLSAKELENLVKQCMAHNANLKTAK